MPTFPMRRHKYVAGPSNCHWDKWTKKQTKQQIEKVTDRHGGMVKRMWNIGGGGDNLDNLAEFNVVPVPY